MICNNILEAMGNTPIIRLSHMVEEGSAEILVKFEGFLRYQTQFLLCLAYTQ